MENYYEEPTQVIFITPEIDNEPPKCGIAYRDEIICAECGGIIEMTDATILKKLSWANLNDEMGGDELLAEKDKFENFTQFAFDENGDVMCLFADGTWKYVADIVDDE